jgi:hypothetical protein
MDVWMCTYDIKKNTVSSPSKHGELQFAEFRKYK